jgi:Recombination endonuclease VII
VATAKRKRRTRREMETARKRSQAAFRHRLKTVHHMEIAEYEAILQIQGGVCYICRKPGVRKRLAVDHDHRIAREQCDHPENESCRRCWRGLLHGPCNNVLALARDTITFFYRAIDYLSDPPARRIGGV